MLLTSSLLKADRTFPVELMSTTDVWLPDNSRVLRGYEQCHSWCSVECECYQGEPGGRAHVRRSTIRRKPPHSRLTLTANVRYCVRALFTCVTCLKIADVKQHDPLSLSIGTPHGGNSYSRCAAMCVGVPPNLSCMFGIERIVAERRAISAEVSAVVVRSVTKLGRA